MYVTPAGVDLGDLVAIVSYTAVGGLILCLTAILALTALGKWEFWRAWRWGLAVGLVPPGIVGLLFLRLIVALVNAALERILGRDLDNSGEVGDVPALRLEIANKEGRTMHFLDLDLDRARLAQFAALARANRLSERDVSAVLNRKQWGELRQRLIHGGYVKWRNPDEPRGGLVVTPAGEALFDRLARTLEVDI
ncbi:MAG: hypothetical protein ACE5HA_08975 [Anaerolineae bacterium]